MNLILIFPEEVSPDGRVLLDGVRAEHIRKVLRAEAGKKLRVGLVDGPIGAGIVESVEVGAVSLACSFDDEVPQRPRVDLLLAMPRPKVLKRLWSQFAALGIGRIYITNAEKVERFYFSTHVIEPKFYRPKLIEGLQQACDTLVPEVQIVRDVETFVKTEAFADVDRKLIADPSASIGIVETLSADAAGRVLLAVGPEGGWTPKELALFEENGFDGVGLGSRILRTDTACIALMGQLAAVMQV